MFLQHSLQKTPVYEWAKRKSNYIKIDNLLAQFVCLFGHMGQLHNQLNVLCCISSEVFTVSVPLLSKQLFFYCMTFT